MKRKRASRPASKIRVEVPFPVVGIGASAGGLEAFRELLRGLPDRPGMAFVLIQHLDPAHESLLAPLLGPSVGFPVVEARDGLRVEPDHVYVIPPNADMILRGMTLKVTKRRGARKRTLPIDAFFNSLGEELKSRAIGVILSGTSSDGVRGLELIKAEGGITFAQDEKSARFADLPRNAVAAGCVDFVLNPGRIASELQRIGRHPYVAEPALSGGDGEEGLDRVLQVLRRAKDADFSRYKRATVVRRVARRMALHRVESYAQYAKHLLAHPDEVDALYEDLLIKVSAFFRDPSSFAALRAKVLPQLFKGRGASQPVRIWVPGCSTGEEAYSIAITVMEHLGQHRISIPVQIFATDLSERAVERARAGLYPENIVADVSPERLRRFFTKVDRGYQIAKPIRDMCVMAHQNLIKDPPFSRIDLVSCRNVLIYMEPALHRRLFTIFHYALRPGGYLMLGSSETVGTFSNLFQLLDRKGKIYARRQASVQVEFDVPPSAEPADRPAADASKSKSAARDGDVQKEVDRIILRRYCPPGVVISEDFEILQFRGDVAAYLKPASGRATLNLLKMVSERLLFEVKAALDRAKDGRPVRSPKVKFARGDRAASEIRIQVIPLFRDPRSERQYLVLFENVSGPDDAVPPAAEPPLLPARRSRIERDLARVQDELETTKEHLQSIIEEQEATNEELKSANEEVLSSNEELQSTNEELETAKEELQSTNEELTTLNEELQTRNAELSQVNSDITNLLTSVNIPIVMVGNDLRIRRFTPPSERLLNLIPGDVGRPITDIKPNFDAPDLGGLVTKSLQEISLVEAEVGDREGHWYSIRIRPYRTLDNKIDGAVIVLLDLDPLKRAAERIGRYQDFASAVWDSLSDALVLLDRGFRLRRSSASFYRLMRTTTEGVDGQSLFELDGGAWNVPKLRETLARVASSDELAANVRIQLKIPRLGPRGIRLRLDARRVHHEESGEEMILMVVTEISEGA